jgi:hypothetical protein
MLSLHSPQTDQSIMVSLIMIFSSVGISHRLKDVKFYMQQREPFSWRMAKTLDEI